MIDLIPRIVECGGAVEAPNGLRHIVRTATVAYCGEDCSGWPRVPHATERIGVWCGVCLMVASEKYK